MSLTIHEIARQALPLMTPEARAEAEQILASLQPPTLEEMKRAAARAWEVEMQPVCTALAEALHDGEMEAFGRLRKLLPALLPEVLADPTLVDLFSLQLGSTIVAGLREEQAHMAGQQAGGAGQ